MKNSSIKIGSLFFLSVSALSLAVVPGCSTLLVGAAATTATVVGIQDKSIGHTIDDATILIKLNKALYGANLFSDISVKVSEGRVLLTGTVPSHEDKETAYRIAKQEPGVVRVMDEIKVDPEGESLGNTTTDALITTKVKAVILALPNVRSVNYSVETEQGSVYLMGIAQSKKELNDVITAARKIPTVKKVVSYVRVKKPRHGEINNR